MQLIGHLHQQAVALCQYRVVRSGIGIGDGGVLLRREARSLAERGDVHAPFVLRTAASANAIDHHFAVAQRQAGLAPEQIAAPPRGARSQLGVVRQHPEQRQDRRCRRRRHAGQQGFQLRRIGRGQGFDARRGVCAFNHRFLQSG